MFIDSASTLTQTKTLHDYTLSGEAGISVQLNTHDLITELTVIGRCFEQGELLGASFAQRNWVDSL
jgi:hypothetical protein